MARMNESRHKNRALNVMGKFLGVFPHVDNVERALYKYTDCGAWVSYSQVGEIIFGSIVEGSDAEFVCDPIPTFKRPKEDVFRDIVQALNWLEGETEVAWHEANMEEEA